MDIRLLRSGALGVIAIARQFGVRITADAIEAALAQGNIRSPKDLEKTLAGVGVVAQFRRVKSKNLQDKLYYYPCVALFNDGTARIVVKPVKNESEPPAFICIDPLDPNSTVETLTEVDFLGAWTGLIILVSKRTGLMAQDRFFEWRWFVPELLRHKWLLAITALTSVIIHLIGLAPIVFIQISFDKVLGYGASTKGNVLLQYCNIDSKLINYIAEVNKFKFNKFTPGTNIKIVSEKEAKLKKPDYLLVLPWHFKDHIIKREQKFLKDGGKLIFPLPDIEII